MPDPVTMQARPSSAADAAAMSSTAASQEANDRSASQAANATAKLQYTVAQRMKEAGEGMLQSWRTDTCMSSVG